MSYFFSEYFDSFQKHVCMEKVLGLCFTENKKTKKKNKKKNLKRYLMLPSTGKCCILSKIRYVANAIYQPKGVLRSNLSKLVHKVQKEKE